MSTATPIADSIARLTPATAKREGYLLVGICEHCTDAVVMRATRQPWVHRGRENAVCLESRRRDRP